MNSLDFLSSKTKPLAYKLKQLKATFAMNAALQAPSFASHNLPGLAFGAISGLTVGMVEKAPASRSALAVSAPASGAAHAQLLVRVGQDRDRAAFVTLFQHFAPRVKSYLMKGGADEATAEEIVQNTFITVWEKADSYSPQKSAASTWIFTIARNKRIDALRRQKFVSPLEDDSAVLDNLAVEAVEAYADPAAIEQLHAAIDTLPKEQAELLRLAFFDDMSHQAISNETDLPLGTVKSRLRLAMDKLRHALGTGDQP